MLDPEDMDEWIYCDECKDETIHTRSGSGTWGVCCKCGTKKMFIRSNQTGLVVRAVPYVEERHGGSEKRV